MAMAIVETRPITGGIDTHLEVHVAAALDADGGVGSVTGRSVRSIRPCSLPG